jgi:cytochrome oxidase Cu insertion factor (SCO1/SenC/PrrC family)
MIKFCTFVIFLLLVVTTVMLFMTRDRIVYISQPAESQGEGVALIGGDFTLVNQDGATVSNKDFHGRVMMVFFGFTHCPDVCPVGAATFAKVLELIGDKAPAVAPIFISVDPARDTPEVLKEYFSNIDSRIIGLTGSDEQIKQVASTYKAYFSKSKIASETEYGVDHSGFIYIMDKDGVYVQHFPYDASAQNIADAVLNLLNKGQ